MPTQLPASALVDILRRKASERLDVNFDYLGILENLRHAVAAEVRFINVLFPEYTPHDEEYHLTRLFYVADTLIQPVRYEGMLATELFVLASGLYAHDWGMAVSDVERDFIITGQLPGGVNAQELAILPDEGPRFERFVAERGLDIKEVRKDGIENDEWREYVRQTHAFRSAERTRHFFAAIDVGVGEAVARVCEAHWLSFEELHNPNRFPSAFSVLREPVNIAALAIYVRLVDLLDIASDRTPYVIWKFVAPRNRRSQMEWRKHRALQPITCPLYQSGRIVQVDGSTDDHEVFAALEDLRAYCDSQLRGCMDLLARIADPRHELDLYHIDWRVVARGFDPVSLRFEFDRERVFELLSSEIYQGDAHVFLRELLQNSVDAIRTRREFLKRGGLLPQSFGVIRVDVRHDSGGAVHICWTDNGVGMDEHVLRNYLAVAGKSYYSSEEFRKLGLKVDAISRFGIGILSCFMVADEVEIETCKDPYAPPASLPLRVKIPAVTKQFRVETLAHGALEVGTKVTVHLEPRLWPSNSEPLHVTQYLKAVAGFVEFPIIVTESGITTVILHPSHEFAVTDSRYLALNMETVQVHQLPLGYPLTEVLLPQDCDAAESALAEVGFDIQDDLAVPGMEGRITFMVPKEDNVWISRVLGDFDTLGIEIHSSSGSQHMVRWREPSYKVRSLPQSATSNRHLLVFKDGILVANAERSHMKYYHQDRLLEPMQVINLLGHAAPELNVSREGFKGDFAYWYDPIQRALDAKLLAAFRQRLKGVLSSRKLSVFGTIWGSYTVSGEALVDAGTDIVPIAVITPAGRVEIRSWDTQGDRIVLAPPQLEQEVHRAVILHQGGDEHEGLSSRWRGDEMAITSNSPGRGMWLNLRIGLQVDQFLLRKLYYPAGVKVVTSPLPNFPPLCLQIWEKKKTVTLRSLEEIRMLAQADPLEISAAERAILSEESRVRGVRGGYNFFDFSPGTEDVFRTGYLVNLRNPVGKLLFQVLMALSTPGRVSPILAGKMRDSIDSILKPWDARTVNSGNLPQLALQAGLIVDQPRDLKGRVWYERGAVLEVEVSGPEFGLPWTPPARRNRRIR